MKKNKNISNAKKMTEQEAMERRRYMRFDLPVDMEYRTLTLNPIFGKALAQDLSKDGMRASLKHSVPKGTPVEVCLNVPGDNLPVFATGKVTWADGLEAGIRFTKIEHRDRARVMEYVYREWLKSNKNAGMSAS